MCSCSSTQSVFKYRNKNQTKEQVGQILNLGLSEANCTDSEIKALLSMARLSVASWKSASDAAEALALPRK